jgi:hypothetical protein
MRHIRRGGEYLRVADPGWGDPLDGSYAGRSGGRWNPPGSFPVVYLCRGVRVARANVFSRLRDQPYGPEDLDPASGPVLVATHLPETRQVDVVTARGCRAAGLPASYPLDARGRTIAHERCQPIGMTAWREGEPGIACRSAAPGASRRDEELAWFGRRRRLRPRRVLEFERWFW